MSNQEKGQWHFLPHWFAYAIRLSLILFVLIPVVARAQFTFTTNNGAITITGYAGSGGAVVIPGTINGFPVTTIGSAAFDRAYSITSVAIPDSITDIESNAFYYCPSLAAITLGTNVADIGGSAFYGCGLTNITIPNSVTSMGNGVFESCSSLANVSIGNGLTNIGQYALLQCTALTNITVDSSNPVYSSAAGALFDKAQETLIQYPVGLTNNSYTISNGVTAIGANAFEGGGNLMTVTIPNSVTNIGDAAFQFCFWLNNLIIPQGVTSIADGTFEGCFRLTNISIPSSVTGIGSGAFWGCSSLSGIVIPAGVTNIGDLAFVYCTDLTSVYFEGGAPPDDGTVFGTPFSRDSATVYYLYGTTGWGTTFSGVSAVEETDPSQFTYATNCETITITGYTGPGGTVVIPETINGYPVAGIGQYAFAACTSLTSVTIPEGTTSIGNNVFWGCTNLVNITLPDTLTTIGSYAFQYCSSLTSVTIPASVTNIEEFAVSLCSGLTNIAVDGSNPNYSSVNGVLFNKAQTTLIQYPLGLTNADYIVPNGVTNIGAQAFDTCVGLTCVTIPNGVKTIGDYAFAYCFNLESVNIPGSITAIGNEAFLYCTSLANTTIPNSVTNLGDYVFSQCTSLKYAYFTGNPPTDLGDAFNGDTTTVYYLPGTTGWGATFGGVAAELWNPQAQNASMSAEQFGFNITGPTNATIVIQACTNLANPVWISVSTNVLDSNGASSFSDGLQTNYPRRFYRFSSR